MMRPGANQKHLINGLHYKVPDMLKGRDEKEVRMLEMKIKIHQAKDLAVSDFRMGYIPIGSDPYVKVRLMKHGYCNIGGESVLYLGKTKVVDKNVNPVWEQTFSATVPLDTISEDALFHLKLFDKDSNSKDDPLGAVKVPIIMPNLDDGETFTGKGWYEVEKTANGEDAQGQVQCTIKLSPSRQIVRGAVKLNEHFYVVKMKVMQAEKLAARDANFFGLNASSDPYVEVRLVTQKNDRSHREDFLENGRDISNDGVLALGATEYIQKTLNPVWNETFSTKLPIDELDSKLAHFLLTIYDRDQHSKDDLMGVVKVPLEPIMERVTPDKPFCSYTHWYDVPPDSAKGEVASGKIRCKVSIALQKAGQAIH